MNLLALILLSSCSSNSCWLRTCCGLLLPLVTRCGVWGTVTLCCLPGDTDRGLGAGLDLNLSGVPEWNFSTNSAWDWNLLPGSAECLLFRPPERLKGTG